MTQAYLTTWNSRPDGSKDCFLTQAVPVKVTTIPGGAKKYTEPTGRMILVSGRWRRVWQWYGHGSDFIGGGKDNTVQMIVNPAQFSAGN